VKIRFQADADLDPSIGDGLNRREPTIDWQPAQGFIPDSTPDLEVLQYSASERRILVSRDVHTMPGQFATFTATTSSPGVVLIPRDVRIGQAIERLLVLWLLRDAEDIANQIWWLNR
jgi:hypothetical protein